MDIIFEGLKEAFRTPYIWPSLGVITALSMFISPIFFNGDYKLATKVSITLLGYIFLASWVNYFHVGIGDGETVETWLHPIIILSLVGLAYILGIFIGVRINKSVSKKRKPK